jgi:hypothetical protein
MKIKVFPVRIFAIFQKPPDRFGLGQLDHCWGVVMLLCHFLAPNFPKQQQQ